MDMEKNIPVEAFDTKLYTASQIADDLQEPPSRVCYIIRKIRMKPHNRIGIIRLFTDEQKQAIKSALMDIQIRE